MRQEYDAYMLRSEQQEMMEIAEKYIGSSSLHIEIQKIANEMTESSRPCATGSKFSLYASTVEDVYTGFKLTADRWPSPVLAGEFVESDPCTIERRQKSVNNDIYLQIGNHITKVFLSAAAIYFVLLAISIAIGMWL